MSRFHQRLKQDLKDPEFAAGFYEMDSEIQLMHALNMLRTHAGLSTSELAQRMGRKREAVSRLFNAQHPNPRLDTLTELLQALGVTASITLRPAQPDEPPLRVEVSEPLAS